MQFANSVRSVEHKPTLSMSQDYQGNSWRIGFSYDNDMDYSFQIVVRHSYADAANDIKVLAFSHGDEREVVTQHEHKQRVDDIMEHEDATEEGAVEFLEERLLVINHNTFWARVEDCRRRWEAMLFLFSPAVTG